MLFNSLQFLAFFIVVYVFYLVLGHRWQNRMLLAASCVFYGAWDWRFLFLMFSSISVDFFCALRIQASDNEKTRKAFVVLSIVVNLAILGFFKYFNFFIDSAEVLLRHGGVPFDIKPLKIILPLGISFYTFEAMSYVIDVYRRKMEPVRSFPDYALFVTYFPHLVAGPIMRARDLLPQIALPRKLTAEKLHEGFYLVCWGFFQKIFIADNLAKVVDPVFAAKPPYDGTYVLIALYAFAFQIYCDFAGYSNIARGLGKLMGFDIMFNFNLPYFSTNPREFWSRWHISLSTWLRDYLYIPLGGNQKGKARMFVNIAVTMLLGGLWHGARWTFVVWGAYQGALLILHRIFEPALKKLDAFQGSIAGHFLFGIRVIFFFHVICLGWLFFRAVSLQQAWDMLQALVFTHQLPLTHIKHYGLTLLFFIFPLGVVEVIQFTRKDLLAVVSWPLAVRFWLYVLMFYLVLVWGQFGVKEFIYFQF